MIFFHYLAKTSQKLSNLNRKTLQAGILSTNLGFLKDQLGFTLINSSKIKWNWRRICEDCTLQNCSGIENARTSRVSKRDFYDFQREIIIGLLVGLVDFDFDFFFLIPAK